MSFVKILIWSYEVLRLKKINDFRFCFSFKNRVLRCTIFGGFCVLQLGKSFGSVLGILFWSFDNLNKFFKE